MSEKILIGCEFSGIVRDEFRKLGFDAYSCDLLESEKNNEFHIRRDVLEILDDGWDALICFPPCTHLCSSGARWFKDKIKEQEEALIFVNKLLNCNIKYIALENPVGIISTKIRKPDQIINPYQFGHGETKRTCLWLKNLPLLIPTKIMKGRNHRIHEMSASNKDRWKDRSRTYLGIGKSMAAQWGDFIQKSAA